MNKTVLVVEDDPGIQSAILQVLEMDDYQVKISDSGEAALKVIQKEGLPDLILLDMRMPLMDGWHFAAEFHRLHLEKIPIVAMSAASDAEKNAAEIHADGWLAKPFTLQQLETTLETFLKKAM